MEKILNGDELMCEGKYTDYKYEFLSMTLSAQGEVSLHRTTAAWM